MSRGACTEHVAPPGGTCQDSDGCPTPPGCRDRRSASAVPCWRHVTSASPCPYCPEPAAPPDRCGAPRPRHCCWPPAPPWPAAVATRSPRAAPGAARVRGDRPGGGARPQPADGPRARRAAGATRAHGQDRQLRGQRPQVGLSDADLVTEELVEGGITRLAVSYYQTIPENVGPVRSMRATDIGIVQPLKATLVASGGAPPSRPTGSGEAGIRRHHRGRHRLLPRARAAARRTTCSTS